MAVLIDWAFFPREGINGTRCMRADVRCIRLGHPKHGFPRLSNEPSGTCAAELDLDDSFCLGLTFKMASKALDTTGNYSK